eukprot:9831111-Alexandrium_andersonii.AAC.1
MCIRDSNLSCFEPLVFSCLRLARRIARVCVLALLGRTASVFCGEGSVCFALPRRCVCVSDALRHR